MCRCCFVALIVAACGHASPRQLPARTWRLNDERNKQTSITIPFEGTADYWQAPTNNNKISCILLLSFCLSFWKTDFWRQTHDHAFFFLLFFFFFFVLKGRLVTKVQQQQQILHPPFLFPGGLDFPQGTITTIPALSLLLLFPFLTTRQTSAQV